MKKIISLIAALAVTVSIIPVSFAENENENITDDYIEIVTDEEVYEETENTENNEIELYGSDIQLLAAYTPRTSAPDKNTVYYGSGNPFYQGLYGWCTWYAWGRAYEILGSRPSLPTSGANRWFNECNSYPKSTDYHAAKVGAIACYSNHVAVVEAVGSDGAPSAISEGGCQSSIRGEICTYLTSTWYHAENRNVNLYFHYGKDYAKSTFKGYIYILNNGSGSANPPAHTHSWSYANEGGHPHKQYRTCSCGAKEYTGVSGHTASCQQCYPLGNVSFTRSHDRIAKTATFYRNNVSNANSYEVTLRKDGSYYDDFTMNGTSHSVYNLRSGTYTATLTVKNTNTGQTRTSTCSSFTIVDSYPVNYNANGGTNAPSSQTKVKDENLTLTSSQPTRAHYIFKGWASSKTATEPQYESGGIYTKNTAITLYAVWEPETYTINFDINGGKGDVPSTKITYGNTMKMPNDVVREGYYLKGWSKTKNSQTVDYRIGLDYGFEQNMTLYAVWGQSTWSGEVADGFAGGNGTENNPYQISNSAELAYFAKKVNSQTEAPKYEYYILTDNIGLQYDEWTPIGLFDYENQYFYGSLNGNGYTVSDLSISQTNAGNIGLFGYAKDSEIKNLTLLGEVVNITSTSVLNIGELIGFSDNTNITDCSVKYVNMSNITAGDADYSNIGCIAGKTSGGEIKGCTADESNIIVKAGSFNTGIICGYSSANITDCSVKSTAELFETAGSDVKNIYMGGLCGQQTRNIEKCTVNAGRLSARDISVTSNLYVAGLVGKVSGKVNLCTVKFTSDTQKTIDGENYPLSISVNPQNASFIGGIAGYFEETAKIKDCMYNGKSISSDSTSSISYVGGLIGYAKAKTPKTVSAQGGQSLSRSSLPRRDGYVATWYTDLDFKNEYDFSQPVTSDMTLYAKWTEGETDYPIWDGTSSEPAYNAETKTYTVTNGQELAWVSDVTNGVITTGTNFPEKTTFEGYTVELANDIYLNNISDVDNWTTNAPANSWKPIGKDYTNYFNGSFDGKNYNISGIYIKTTESNVGLFGCLQNKGTIENIGVANCYIDGYGTIGSIVGSSNGYVSHCYNAGTVNGNGSVGGVVGYSSYSVETNYCYNTGIVNGNSYVGGVVGYSNQSETNYCYNAGIVNGNSYVGGVVGYSDQSKITSYCYNTGTVNGNSRVGGVVGACNAWNGMSATVSYCYNIGTSCGTSYVGSIVGIGGGDKNQFGYITNFCIEYCYSNKTPLYNSSNSYVSVTSVFYKSDADIKTLSKLNGFSTNIWATDSNINNGYPYLKSNIPYTVTIIEDINDFAAINHSFANVDGALFSNAKTNSYAGGVIGYGFGTKSDAKNLLSVANKISSKTSGSSYKAYAGDIIGENNNNAFNFSSVYTNSNLDLSAENTTTVSNIKTDTIATPWSDAQLKRAANLIRIFGPYTYQSLEYLKEHSEAVWVIKDGELPELYYNVLRDITLDKVENGTISVDKTQAVDGEIVTVTATPAENYQLNKIYVNGEEVVGNTFEVNGDSKVYALFTEETPEYTARVESTSNAVASLVDVDSASEISLMSVDDTISTQDGNEIRVNTEADTDYAVEAVYVNGEELNSDSFIITEDSVVTMDVVNISTDIKAVTGDAESIGNYFALLSGSVEDVDGAERYIRYWTADNPDEIYTTEVQEGSGDYSVFVEDLIPETTYQYQMCESGEIKSFTTLYSMVADGDGSGDITTPTNTPQESDKPIITDTPANPTEKPQETDTPTETDTPVIVPETMPFEIQNATLNSGYASANIVNISDAQQSGLVIFVAYSDTGALLAVKTRKIENLDTNTSRPCEFELPDNTAHSKLFVWNSWKDMLPLAESIEIK